MKQGTVKWFDSNKGFVFIEADSMTDDVFVHFSVIDEDGFKNLDDGQEVMFEYEMAEKGPQATFVEKQ